MEAYVKPTSTARTVARATRARRVGTGMLTAACTVRRARREARVARRMHVVVSVVVVVVVGHVVAGRRVTVAAARARRSCHLGDAVLVRGELGVADRQLLALVTRQLDAASQLLRDVALVATLAQERVDRLNTVPACNNNTHCSRDSAHPGSTQHATLLSGHLGQVRGGLPVVLLVDELDANAVFADLQQQPQGARLACGTKRGE